MPDFMTRVVLHGADWPEYDKLHGYMQTEGFSRTIKSVDGRTYKLPAGEYYCSAALTSEQVRENAKRAATRTLKDYAVRITQSNGVVWYGLEKL